MSVAVAALVVLAACGGGNNTTTTNRVLVVDKSFDMKTADPQREFEVSGGIVAKALYSTLLTFKGADSATPVPAVASSYSASSDAKTFTFKLRADIKFSDGTPLTSADVVFSFNRLINIKGNPSFLLDGVTVSSPDSSTVVLTSKSPNPALPFIIPNPALGIVNSKVVKAHGGTDQPGADKADQAESFLNTTSEGSGPYTLKSFSTTSEVDLTANPNYWGPKPFYNSVVIRNIQAPVQLVNIQKGSNEIALDLSPDQASTLNGISSLQVKAIPGPNVFFLLANNNPKVSSITPNKHFQNAIRSGLDYASFVQLAGAGAIQTPGVVPSMFLGALPQSAAVKRDLNNAKAELAASGISNPTVNLGFPSDFTLNCISFSTLAQKVQANLQEVGIKVNLTGSPISTALADYRAGTEQLGLWLWGPDYPDPNDYLVFLPGQLVGLRAGWVAGADPSLEALGTKASTTTDNATRKQLFQQIQTQLNTDGPFFPLIQPGQVVVATKGVTGADYNPTWTIDVSGVGG
ncbi:MAG: ABC transporter substrate-binding protein [Candidatus Dormibacteraeota bacterium]|nr:ABC transporter substrate-binding protein [Candidatus Dormibacteraeota bacterium]